MKHRSLYVVLGVAAMVASESDPVRAQDRVAVSIGVVVDGPWDRNDEILGRFQQEITALLSGDFDVRFPDQAQVDGAWTTEGVRNALDRVLEDPEVDLVLTIGVLGSVEAARLAVLPKPVIAPLGDSGGLEQDRRHFDREYVEPKYRSLRKRPARQSGRSMPSRFMREKRVVGSKSTFPGIGLFRVWSMPLSHSSASSPTCGSSWSKGSR